MESTFQKIIRKSGRKPISCKCNECKKQCLHPCIGTPEDMELIKIAGFGDRLIEGEVENTDIIIIAPKYDSLKKACTFFTNGLCELHDLGLKPTVGKLSHHSTTHIKQGKMIADFVLKEWQIKK